jgi:hypothetical protein
MDDIYVDIRGANIIDDRVLVVSRAKAYQMILCLVSMLATSDSNVSNGAFGALAEEDDDRLPPQP